MLAKLVPSAWVTTVVAAVAATLGAFVLYKWAPPRQRRLQPAATATATATATAGDAPKFPLSSRVKTGLSGVPPEPLDYLIIGGGCVCSPASSVCAVSLSYLASPDYLYINTPHAGTRA